MAIGRGGGAIDRDGARLEDVSAEPGEATRPRKMLLGRAGRTFYVHSSCTRMYTFSYGCTIQKWMDFGRFIQKMMTCGPILRFL